MYSTAPFTFSSIHLFVHHLFNRSSIMCRQLDAKSSRLLEDRFVPIAAIGLKLR